MYRFRVFGQAEFTITKQPVVILWDFISIFDWVLVIFDYLSKSIAPSSAQIYPGEGSTQKPPAALGHQFAQLAQPPAAFHPLFRLMCTNSSAPSSLQFNNDASRPFLLQFPPDCLRTNHISHQRLQRKG